MRIGNVVLDTDNMTSEEVNMWIQALRKVRARKIEQENFTLEMNALITTAKEKGFVFINKGFEPVRKPDDFTVWDEKA